MVNRKTAELWYKDFFCKPFDWPRDAASRQYDCTTHKIRFVTWEEVHRHRQARDAANIQRKRAVTESPALKLCYLIWHGGKRKPGKLVHYTNGEPVIDFRFVFFNRVVTPNFNDIVMFWRSIQLDSRVILKEDQNEWLAGVERCFSRFTFWSGGKLKLWVIVKVDQIIRIFPYPCRQNARYYFAERYHPEKITKMEGRTDV